jgi:hypothetical protein
MRYTSNLDCTTLDLYHGALSYLLVGLHTEVRCATLNLYTPKDSTAPPSVTLLNNCKIGCLLVEDSKKGGHMEIAERPKAKQMGYRPYGKEAGFDTQTLTEAVIYRNFQH